VDTWCCIADAAELRIGKLQWSKLLRKMFPYYLPLQFPNMPITFQEEWILLLLLWRTFLIVWPLYSLKL
jgi:hypothetical protein